MSKFEFKDVDEKRSKIMSSIHSKDTKPELLLRKELYHRGYRYRINYSKLPGKPDIVFTRKRIVIFCDGDFWHGRNWEQKKATIKTKRGYWISKIESNMERDKRVSQKLKQIGWTVMRFWESDILENLDSVVATVESKMNG